MLQGGQASVGAKSRDLTAVITHEFGHFLGVLHPCEPGGEDGAPKCSKVAGADETAMYPIYSADQRALADDDVQAVCFLYPGQACTQDECPSGYKCTDVGCKAECGNALCEVGELCQATDDGERCLMPGDCRLSGNCGGEQECDSTADCAQGLTCTGGKCTEPTKVDGDACKTGEECPGQVCDGGVCTSACATDDDCATGLCSKEKGTTGVCAGGGLGDACESPSECLGGECLESSDAETPVCTRACGEGLAGCPADWRCDTVSGEQVCVPRGPIKVTGGGCTFHATQPTRSATPGWITALAQTILGGVSR